MVLFLQLILDGLASGAIYGALALALVLIYRATHVVNFGQGEMATFSAYLAWQLCEWGLPIGLSLLIVAILSFGLGVAVFWTVVRPMYRAPSEAVAVLTLGLFVIFGAACLWIWGAEQRQFPVIFPDVGWTIGGVRVTANMLGLLATLCVVAIVLACMFQFTRFGLALRASAAEPANSLLVGLRVEKMLTLGWGLAGVVGFLAAVLIAPHLFLSPSMMVPVLIYALASATLGGWDSPMGAIAGGLMIGVAESLGATFLPFIGAELRLFIPIAVALLVLLACPAGLFGRKAVIRV
jgi:branched-chain amino acid transport system permease protein